MKGRANSRFVWFLWGVCIVGTIAGVVLTVASSTRWGPDQLFGVIIPIGLLTFPTVGAIVASRTAGNIIGWMLLTFGLVSAIGPTGDAYAAFRPALPAAVYGGVAGLATIDSPAVMAFFVFFFLLFPDGHLPTRRWRPFARYCGVVTGLVVLYAVFVQPVLEPNGTKFANPVAIRALGPASNPIQGPLFLALIVCVPVAGASFVMRFRRSHGVERKQMKWFASAAVLMGVMVGLSPLAFNLSVAPAWLWPVMFLVGATSIPVAAGIAITRYRLYDIDRIISRTLSYAIVTASLVAAYVALVVVFQAVTRPLMGRSDLAIAASTLIVAAMFVPLRRRIQDAVDHRFNRKRYDAAQTIDAFTAHLRDEVDIDTLGAELESVVGATMQPAHVSLWLRTYGT